MSKPLPPPVTRRYVLENVSSKNPVRVEDETGKLIERSKTQHNIFRFTLAVPGTNRAAMSEYLYVMRPIESGSRAYEYLERTAVVKNQIGVEDVNTPILETTADGKLYARLNEYETKQDVIVVVTRIL